MEHQVTIGPVRVEAESELAVARHLRGVGYSWRCRCGVRGPVLRSWREARSGALAHQEAARATAGKDG